MRPTPFRSVVLAALGFGVLTPAFALDGLDLPRLDPSAQSLAAAPPAATGPRVTARRKADLRGAEPCPSQGPGFVRLPGAATCVRLSGRATAAIAAGIGRAGAAARPEASGRFAIDTRTDTDLGPVRTFVRMGAGHR